MNVDVEHIVQAVKRDGFAHANPTLIQAVLAGTAMIAATGAGVSPELESLIKRIASEPTLAEKNRAAALGPYEADPNIDPYR